VSLSPVEDPDTIVDHAPTVCSGVWRGSAPRSPCQGVPAAGGGSAASASVGGRASPAPAAVPWMPPRHHCLRTGRSDRARVLRAERDRAGGVSADLPAHPRGQDRVAAGGPAGVAGVFTLSLEQIKDRRPCRARRRPVHIADPLISRIVRTVHLGLLLHPPSQDRRQSKTRNLLVRLRDYQPQVLPFARDLAAPFTDNQAERDPRMITAQLKITGGWRTEHGARAGLRVRGYISAARLDIITALSDAGTGNPCLPTPIEITWRSTTCSCDERVFGPR